MSNMGFLLSSTSHFLLPNIPAPFSIADNITSKDLDLLCFGILGHYCARLFISHEKPLEHVTLTQKDPKGKISWVEFDAPFHSCMIKAALTLFDKPPLLMAKHAFFIFVLEVLNLESTNNFFAQKEHTLATTPTLMGRKCQTCGQIFATHKTYTRHTYMHVWEKDGRGGHCTWRKMCGAWDGAGAGQGMPCYPTHPTPPLHLPHPLHLPLLSAWPLNLEFQKLPGQMSTLWHNTVDHVIKNTISAHLIQKDLIHSVQRS